ncbi:helix-turn-helix domain-containing protein [Sphingomonas sp. HITSZ_GF]|uniref:helix-turn-helix domain-containing protein n=1 Tax=Sphingomonas sp. HITSZ_GF TaxID=3037247 RepID=UPI00240E63B6|nr:helix-turn-helix domain-containing protein [Sphingomonas sp. HITSZ_GF]MDG2534318.1 helix-turn-helix domain-containing protein [Sphingomonas sp. HITSZ_GF]
MPKRNFLLADPAKPEGSDNPHTRAKIADAILALMAEGDRLNHDQVAERSGVSRRTVYRYYPDQAALRAAAWARVGPAGGIPTTLDAFVGDMAGRFANFDDKADAMTVVMASAEGRAIRNVMKPERVTAFRAMLAPNVEALAEPDRTRAIAAIQLLGSGFAWREMRDQWDMDGPEAAAACRWAIETLLADLERRGGKPLTGGPA